MWISAAASLFFAYTLVSQGLYEEDFKTLTSEHRTKVKSSRGGNLSPVGGEIGPTLPRTLSSVLPPVSLIWGRAEWLRCSQPAPSDSAHVATCPGVCCPSFCALGNLFCLPRGGVPQTHSHTHRRRFISRPYQRLLSQTVFGPTPGGRRAQG